MDTMDNRQRLVLLLGLEASQNAILTSLVERRRERLTRNRRVWISSINRHQPTLGHSASLFHELRRENELASSLHYTAMRVTPEQFDELLNLVGPLIQRKDTRFRKCVPPSERLSITLTMMAQGVKPFFTGLHYRRDGLDGKQARRTGSSSALGELFDHGLDSWACFYLTISMYDMFGRGTFGTSPLRMLFVFFTVLVVFAVSHWEKYNTRILFLPWGYDVAQVGMTLMYLITFIYSESVWKVVVPHVDVTFGFLAELTMYVQCFLLSLPMSFWNVYKAYQTKAGYMRSPWENIRPLVPFFVLFTLVFVWAYFSPSKILDGHPRAYYFMVGALFSNMACELIVSQMSSTRCKSFNWLLVPLAAATIISCIAPHLVSEAGLLYGLAVLVTLAHLNYGVHVIEEMADNLNIYVFSVKKKAKKAINNNNNHSH